MHKTFSRMPTETETEAYVTRDLGEYATNEFNCTRGSGEIIRYKNFLRKKYRQKVRREETRHG